MLAGRVDCPPVAEADFDDFPITFNERLGRPPDFLNPLAFVVGPDVERAVDFVDATVGFLDGVVNHRPPRQANVNIHPLRRASTAREEQNLPPGLELHSFRDVVFL